MAQSRLLLLLTGVGGSSQRPHFIKKPATPPNVAPCTAAPQPTPNVAGCTLHRCTPTNNRNTSAEILSERRWPNAKLSSSVHARAFHASCFMLKSLMLERSSPLIPDVRCLRSTEPTPPPRLSLLQAHRTARAQGGALRISISTPGNRQWPSCFGHRAACCCMLPPVFRSWLAHHRNPS